MSIEGEGRSDQHQAHPMRTPEGGYPYEDEINLLDYWKVIWLWRRAIAGLCVGTVFTAMVVSLMSPKTYTSTVTMTPPAQSEGGGLSMLMGGGEGALLQGLLGGAPSTGENTVLALLDSRTMAEETAKHFDLVTLFETETFQGAVGMLQDMTEIEWQENELASIITITVEAEDPQLATDLANFYAENLDHMAQSMNLTAAKRNRVFIEERLAETKDDLRQAEDNIKDFQLNNRAVFLAEQAAGSIEEVAVIHSQITAVEVELKVLGASLTPEHPDLMRLAIELEQLQKKLSVFEVGAGGKGELSRDRVYPAWISVPGLAVELGKYQRELKIKEEVYKLLTTQLEQAKIEEVKDDPMVQVIDPALPPDGPSGPRVKLAMLISGVLALFVGVILAFVMDYVRRMSARSEETAIS